MASRRQATVIGAVIATLLVAPAAFAQEIGVAEAVEVPGLLDPIVGDAASGGLQGSIVLREDASLRRRLTQAIRLTESGRFNDAARALGRLVEATAENDVFVRGAGPGQSSVSLKREVQRRIAALPPEGRDAYEMMFGTAARRMLADGRADRALVQRVAELYLHTAAGAEALYRLAMLHRDSGDFAEAAACLKRLQTERPDAAGSFEPQLSIHLALCRLRCGDATAKDLIAELSGDPDGASIVVAGHEHRWSPALVQELIASAAATTAVDVDRGPGTPFMVPRWSHELTAGYGHDAHRSQVGGSAEAIPFAAPAVINDLVLVPRSEGFVTHDLATGRRLWSYPSDSSGSKPTSLASSRISTADGFVFVVEGGPTLAGGVPDDNFAGAFAPFQQAAFVPALQAVPGTEGQLILTGDTANVLTALDVRPPRQGNRVWLVGGESGHDEPRLAGVTFLGPPLAVGGRLYAIVERDRTTTLAVLDAASGRLVWSVALGESDMPLAQDPERLLIGATPSLIGDLLVCPTGGGAVIAVDRAARSLRWGFRYPRQTPPAIINAHMPLLSMEDRWLEPNAIALGLDRVLVSPPESNQIYCLTLETGEVQWQIARDDISFVGAATHDRVLLVGASSALLLFASTGLPVASRVTFPEALTVAGRGYSDGEEYLQPMSDGSIFRIDLRIGTMTKAISPMRGIVLGSLSWHRGQMISLGSDFVRLFDDRDQLTKEIDERLAADPSDVAALLRRADLHAAAGRHAESIADCRRAFELAPTPQTRNALVAALLDGIRHELPGSQEYDADLVRLSRP